jgi:hypothetical protein
MVRCTVEAEMGILMSEKVVEQSSDGRKKERKRVPGWPKKLARH